MAEFSSSVQASAKSTSSWAETQESLSGQRHSKRQDFREQEAEGEDEPFVLFLLLLQTFLEFKNLLKPYQKAF